MRIVALGGSEFGKNFELLKAMFGLRRRIFTDRLGWDVSSSGELELDVFDTLHPVYLIATSDDNEVLGSVRLLPTMGPTMLGNCFPDLLGQRPLPCRKDIIESSRFCVDTARAVERVENGLNRATIVLFAAMLETLQRCRGEAIVTVTDVRMERILRRAGWPLDVIEPAKRIGETMAVAGFLHASDQALMNLYRLAGISGPLLAETYSGCAPLCPGA